MFMTKLLYRCIHLHTIDPNIDGLLEFTIKRRSCFMLASPSV